MKNYCIFDSLTNDMKCVAEVAGGTSLESETQFVIEIDAATHKQIVDERRRVYWNGSDIVFAPHKPDIFHEWDSQTKSWVQLENVGQLMAESARATRDSLLLSSDWTQLPDVPAQLKQAWATYRQALRDITNQPGFPATIDWPVQPT
jgi:hypothetical protein